MKRKKTTGEKMGFIREQIKNLNLLQRIYWVRDPKGERRTAVCLIKDEDGNVARGISFWNVDEDVFSVIEAKYYSIKRAIRAYRKGTDKKSITNVKYFNPDERVYKSEFIGQGYEDLTGKEKSFMRIPKD